MNVEIHANIASIVRHRVDIDGPGTRTLVGFSGCPLECKYCINKDIIKEEFGNPYTPEQLLEEVIVDNSVLSANGGGISFGGGEPALQSEFIVRFHDICPSEWTLVMETSLNVPQEKIEPLLNIIDYWYIDIKDMNPEIYKKYTGRTNEQVISNLKYMVSHDYKGRIVCRTPKIEGYNTDSNLLMSVLVLSKMGLVNEYEEFKYNTNGSVKLDRPCYMPTMGILVEHRTTNGDDTIEFTSEQIGRVNKEIERECDIE